MHYLLVYFTENCNKFSASNCIYPFYTRQENDILIKNQIDTMSLRKEYRKKKHIDV